MIQILLDANLVLLGGLVVLLILVMLRPRENAGDLVGKAVQDDLRAGREEAARAGRALREELAGNLAANTETLTKTLAEMGQLQRAQLEGVAAQLQNLNESNRAGVEQLRATVSDQLQRIQETNEKRLEDMRRTVDEKLEVTLQSRLGESFKLVSTQLEAVHQGLGEMKNLAGSVGDLKRVLSDVKTRGIWGEVQLGAILEQVLAAEQYGCQVVVNPGASERVDFAIRLPGNDDEPDTPVWLPIDSKFPQEDYLRLVEASAAGDQPAVQSAVKELTARACGEAKQIHDKYICPPATTDFAVMFLPTEGLFAEIIRQPGLVEDLQRKYRVVVAGPTTLIALLNSLRMGFRTLAIQKRASEVWKVLAAVKAEFTKFGGTLDKVKKQLQTVSNTIEDTGKRSRAIERKLREVEELPAGAETGLLPLDPDDDGEEELPPG
jgi:DNA recombination protein RmuC